LEHEIFNVIAILGRSGQNEGRWHIWQKFTPFFCGKRSRCLFVADYQQSGVGDSFFNPTYLAPGVSLLQVLS
jgi:hypothetical protein